MADGDSLTVQINADAGGATEQLSRVSAAHGMTDSPIAGGPGIVINLHLDNSKFFTSADLQAATNAMGAQISTTLARYQSGQLAGGTAARSNRRGNF